MIDIISITINVIINLFIFHLFIYLLFIKSVKVGVGEIGSSGARYGAMISTSSPIILFHQSDLFNNVGAVTFALEQASYFAQKADVFGKEYRTSLFL